MYKKYGIRLGGATRKNLSGLKDCMKSYILILPTNRREVRIMDRYYTILVAQQQLTVLMAVLKTSHKDMSTAVKTKHDQELVDEVARIFNSVARCANYPEQLPAPDSVIL
jgi:hypothetical protein